MTYCCSAHVVNAASISGNEVVCAKSMQTDAKSGCLGLVVPGSIVGGLLGLWEGQSLLIGGVIIGVLFLVS